MAKVQAWVEESEAAGLLATAARRAGLAGCATGTGALRGAGLNNVAYRRTIGYTRRLLVTLNIDICLNGLSLKCSALSAT